MINDGLGDDTAPTLDGDEPIDDIALHELETLQQAAITQGVSVSTLSVLFDKPPSDIKRAMGNVTPCGYRGKKPLYKLSEAAKYLADPVVDIATWMKSLKPSDIPAQLSREYWQGQLSKQKFEIAAGQLWKTERVQAVLGEIFKITRQRIMLFADTVDQQTSLTPDQRDIVEGMADGLLADIANNIRDSFAFYESEDRDELLSSGDADFQASAVKIKHDL